MQAEGRTDRIETGGRSSNSSVPGVGGDFRTRFLDEDGPVTSLEQNDSENGKGEPQYVHIGRVTDHNGPGFPFVSRTLTNTVVNDRNRTHSLT